MSIGFLVFLSLALGVATWLLFVWTVRSGQYDDPEGPKYRMLDDDEAGEPGAGGEGEGDGEAGRGGGREPDKRR